MLSKRSFPYVLPGALILALAAAALVLPLGLGEKCSSPCGHEVTVEERAQPAYRSYFYEKVKSEGYDAPLSFPFLPFSENGTPVISGLSPEKDFIQELHYYNGLLSVGSQGPFVEFSVANGTLEPVWISHPTLRDLSFRTIYADMDRNGEVDVVVGNYGQETKVYFRHNGTLDENHVWVSSLKTETMSLAVGDVDGDGFDDIIEGTGNSFSTNSKGAVYIYWNLEGNITKTPQIARPFNSSVSGLSLADLEGDGRMDLAVSTWGGKDFVFRGNPKGRSFYFDTPRLEVDDGSLSQDALWADIRGDGYPDVLFLRDGAPDVLYDNNKGRFLPAPSWISEGADETHVGVWGDIDRNGYPDVVTGGKEGVFVYLNLGFGFPRTPVQHIPLEAVHGICLVDVNKDGWLDLIAGSGIATNLTIFPNVLHTGPFQKFLDIYGTPPSSPGFLSSLTLVSAAGALGVGTLLNHALPSPKKKMK